LTDEQVMEMILDALSERYHGISFRLDDKDWDLSDDILREASVFARWQRKEH
jgi:hypothetical protein